MRVRSSFVVAALAIAGWPSIGRAQADCPGLQVGEPSAYRFYTAPGAGSFLQVDGVAVGRELEPAIGLMLDYAHRPFALDDPDYYTCTSDTPSGRELDVVAGTFTIQLAAALAFADVFQIGLNLPVIAHTFGEGYRWEGGDPPRPFSFPSGSGTTLGDPRLHGKLRIFEQDLGGDAYLGLAVVGWITFPVARAILPRRYAGEPSVAGGLHLVLGFRWEGLRVAINVGAGIREDAQLILSRRTSEMTWGAGLAYDFTEIFGALAEISGQTTFGLVYDDEAPTEVRGALYLRIGDLTLMLGAGAGIAYAIGTPVVRVLGGAQWEPRPRRDSDRDGLTDDVDACPADPEDADGSGDEDGCPDRDDDGDGVLDGYDSCPGQVEDVDGDRDTDGCPDDDRDRDRIPDSADPCPDHAEDTDGLGDEDGCPEHDFDADGVPDEDDECADRGEDADGFEDGDGCPEEGGGEPRRIRGR